MSVELQNIGTERLRPTTVLCVQHHVVCSAPCCVFSTVLCSAPCCVFRRHLTVCPILEGEEHLRLLNFQHNLITRIQHLSNLRRLIFLDLYDNHIEEMNGLSALKSLRVLMLGKNR